MNNSSAVLVEFLGPSDPRWTEALQKTPHDFFHLPGYLSACGVHEGGEPLLLMLDAGSYGMLIPVIKRSLSQFGEVFSGYFDASSPYGYPGPVCWGDNWEDLVPVMDDILEIFLREQKMVSLFLRLNPFLGISAEHPTLRGELKMHGPTVFLDLRDADESWKAINSRLRSFITQMLREGCEVRIDQWETLEQVIEAYHETMGRLNASPFYFFPKAFFQSLKDDTAPHFHLGTSYAPSGEVTGGVFFSEVNGLIQYFLTGTFMAYSDLSPSKLIINALRLWGLEKGHHTLHLGGGLGAQTENLFQFKSRFSKSLATFSTFRKIILPEEYQALSISRGDNDDFFPIYRKPS